MPRPDPHPRGGHDLETLFDLWLDALATGTPAAGASRPDPSDRRLALAQTGARQLHELAASAVLPGAALARQRVKERLMRHGALAVPSGTSWQSAPAPERRIPWWSPASSVMATAMTVAVIAVLVAGFFWNQRTALSPDPTDAPGLGVGVGASATPDNDGLSCAAPGYRAVMSGDVDAATLATLGETQEPIVTGTDTTFEAVDGTPITIDGRTTWTPYPFPDNNIILSVFDGTPRTATILSTGESWTFPVVDMGRDEPEPSFVMVGRWLIGVTDASMTDWRIIDTRTGEDRLTSDIFGDRFAEALTPVTSSTWVFGTSPDTGLVQFVPVDSEEATDSPAPPLVLTDDLADAYALDAAHASAGGNGVATPDSERIVYMEDRTVRVLDATTGEQIDAFPAPDSRDDLSFVAITADSSRLILKDSQVVWTVHLDTGAVTMVFGPEGFIQSLQHDRVTGNLLVGTDGRTPEKWHWIDPISGDTIQVDILDTALTPSDGFGWMLFSAEPAQDTTTIWRLLDMATGRIVANVETSQTVVGPGTWATGGPPNEGIYIVQQGNDALVVLDGPEDKAFEMPIPEGVDRPDGTGVSVGVSPNNQCIVFTLIAATGETNMSWVAPLEPGAAWTRLDVELVGWWAIPSEPEVQTLPAMDLVTPDTSPAATPVAFEPDLQIPATAPINLRLRPTTDDRVVDVLPPGTPLMTVGESVTNRQTDDRGQRWINVRTESGDVGWIREVDLEPYSDAGATPAPRTFDALFPIGAVPILSDGPHPDLSPGRSGGLTDDGLVIPLRDGDTLLVEDGLSVSQLPFTTIVTVDVVGGARLPIDLDTGETMAELPPPADDEQLVGTYLFTPTNDDDTVWTVTDIRTGDRTTTAEVRGEAFDVAVLPLHTGFDPDDPTSVVVQFGVSPTARPDLESYDPGALVIPGSLDDDRFIERIVWNRDFMAPPVAIQTRGDTTLLAYVSDAPQPRIVIEDAITGDSIATHSVTDLRTDGVVPIAGFTDDGTGLVVWSGSTVSLVQIDTSSSVGFDIESPPIERVVLSGTSALVTAIEIDGSGTVTSVWYHLDLDTGTVTDLPELDGYRLDRGGFGTPWLILEGTNDPNSTSTIIVDADTGAIAARLDDPNLGTSTAGSPARDFSVFVFTGNTDQTETTGYAIDARSGESWAITPPEVNGEPVTGVYYQPSPDGSLLIATTPRQTWVSPMQPDAAWVSLGEATIDTWLAYQEEDPNP